MEFQVVDTKGQPAGSLSVADAVFEQQFNEPLVHQVLVAYWAGGRAGTKAQKSRSEVRGGGAKPWRQKGTGRARAGTIRSPIWRGGGVTFAAKPRDHRQKVNKRMYRAAMRAIISELARQDRIVVIDALSLPQPKTRLMVELLNDMGISGGRTLLVTEQIDQNLTLAARNIPYVSLSNLAGLNPDSLIRNDRVVIGQAAMAKLGESLA